MTTTKAAAHTPVTVPKRRVVSGQAYTDMVRVAEERLALIDELTKKLKSAESSRDYNATRAVSAEGELAQVHMLLDAMPNSPPRKSGDDYPREFSTMTRLAAWLAHRGTQP